MHAAAAPTNSTREQVDLMSDKESTLLFWYEELEGADFPLVGKKNANLGEMIKVASGRAPVSP